MDDFLQDIVDCFNHSELSHADTAEEVIDQLDKIIKKEVK